MTDNIINVLIAMSFSDELLEQLRGVSPKLQVVRHFPEVPDEAWESVEVLYTARILPEPGQAPNLKWVQLHSAGMDHMRDRPLILSDAPPMLTSASGIHAVPMAEYAIGMMVSHAYKFPMMWDLQRQSLWPEDRDDYLAPLHLRGKTVGIVGYGSIGRELARLCHAMGMNVLAVKNNVMQPADHTSYVEAVPTPAQCCHSPQYRLSFRAS
ncbi:MAG: NAD(P)-dependent oxidoreductase, partial [Chloroflexota bacterium]